VVELEGPSGDVMDVVVGLPPGVTLDGTVQAMRLGLGEVVDLGDRVQLRTLPLNAGETVVVRLPVLGSFAGDLASVPHELTVLGQSVTLPPTRWAVW
jgi:hypothetical protein